MLLRSPVRHCRWFVPGGDMASSPTCTRARTKVHTVPTVIPATVDWYVLVAILCQHI